MGPFFIETSDGKLPAQAALHATPRLRGSGQLRPGGGARRHRPGPGRRDRAGRDRYAAEARRHQQYPPQLKGSIGGGPNHSNFSDQSSVKIQELF